MSALITVQKVSAVHFSTIQLIYNIDPWLTHLIK